MKLLGPPTTRLLTLSQGELLAGGGCRYRRSLSGDHWCQLRTGEDSEAS